MLASRAPRSALARSLRLVSAPFGRASSTLTTADINQSVLAAQYAVRGELVLRAAKIKEDMSSMPFDKVLECNIGNPQAVGQTPLSFNRQVLSLICCPALLDQPGVDQLFASDAIARAKEYIAAIPGGIGAYSESQGFRIVRDQVAAFIEARDNGIPASADDIFLTDGASKGPTRREAETAPKRPPRLLSGGCLEPAIAQASASCSR